MGHPVLFIDFLRNELTSSARDMGRILIVADSASLAIIIIMTIHNHFIRLKEKEHFERPYIFLNRKVYEYAQVLCTRLQDLHPNSARSVEREFNPFQSAMIRWIKNKKDIKEAERLMKTEKSRGSIVILDPSDMGKNWVADFLKIIASDQYNAIYFAGKLKDEISIELVSGEDNLTLKDSTILQNKARILNRIEPRNILNLHADRLQLEKLLKELQPRKQASELSTIFLVQVIFNCFDIFLIHIFRGQCQYS